MPTDLLTLSDSEIQTRDLTCRELCFRAESIDEEARSFEAVVATEQPARVFDYQRWEVVDEILVARGGVFPDQVPLLRNHQRSELEDVLGSARQFQKTGDRWIGRGFMARAANDSDPVEKYWRLVADGHLRAVSIGYQVREFVDIEPGGRQNIDGRDYEAGNSTLRVTTDWRVHELSLTPIGADAGALIRKHQTGEPVPKKRSYFR